MTDDIFFISTFSLDKQILLYINFIIFIRVNKKFVLNFNNE